MHAVFGTTRSVLGCSGSCGYAGALQLLPGAAAPMMEGIIARGGPAGTTLMFMLGAR